MQKLRKVKDKVAQLTGDNGALSSTDQEAAQILGQFFSSVFVHETATQLEDSEQSTNQTDNPEVTIDEETVKRKLLKLQEDKEQGPDSIHPAVLRNCAYTLSKPLSLIFKKSFQEGILPDDWKSATLCLIFKKSDKSHPGSYRPVSLMTVPCKVMESIIKDTVMAYLDTKGFYDSCQHGFVKGRSMLRN